MIELAFTLLGAVLASAVWGYILRGMPLTYKSSRLVAEHLRESRTHRRRQAAAIRKLIRKIEAMRSDAECAKPQFCEWTMDQIMRAPEGMTPVTSQLAKSDKNTTLILTDFGVVEHNPENVVDLRPGPKL